MPRLSLEKALSAVLSVRGWQLCRCPLLHAEAARALLQAPAGPSRVPTEPRPGGAAGRPRGSPGSSRRSAPSGARRQRLLAAPQGCAGRGGRGCAQRAPGPGAEPAPSLPCCRSLQLAEDRSRAAEHLRRALRYLQSPREPLREAAIRFMGIAGRYLKGQPAELHVLREALEAMSKDDSPSSTNLEIQAIFGQRSAELRSSAGLREPGSQEQYQETVKRPPLNVSVAPGTADAGDS
ncbi:uncharacterized protein LOC119703438 isoform X1 [Motacilla alba alba]|uniref:uncharacterized protein LOC119703438 isoform X1 n=1 Tax=Motacilla alba alba TaxID=1094192 RepID=UPI0018D58BA0|nr:uncharacterized protein LOC119703438 isoform X1 [Motacilla alba alba]